MRGRVLLCSSTKGSGTKQTRGRAACDAIDKAGGSGFGANQLAMHNSTWLLRTAELQPALDCAHAAPSPAHPTPPHLDCFRSWSAAPRWPCCRWLTMARCRGWSRCTALSAPACKPVPLPGCHSCSPALPASRRWCPSGWQFCHKPVPVCVCLPLFCTSTLVVIMICNTDLFVTTPVPSATRCTLVFVVSMFAVTRQGREEGEHQQVGQSGGRPALQ